ncbi:caspase family protein [Polyangium aurulentum]|uniref:caspase family protein n=1 Tax=Polyangium aurulentum TaxID=2567896 RepID=UPI0010ADF337|nr:caspase family protein [Polyangium aurulentum]UQA60720.1 caspase family protein [Polyangium aurulentum]
MSSSQSSAELPAGFRLAWSRDGVRPEEAAIWLDRKAAPGAFDSLAALLFRGRPPYADLSFPLGEVTIGVRAFPHLDEVWTLYMLACKERGEALPAAWEAMCRYVADVRQGLWPDRVEPEHAVQAVYLAMAQHFLLQDPPRRDGFIDEALALCAHVGGRLAAGARLLDDDLLAGEARFERYVALLAQDRRLYEEDRGRSQRFFAELPAAMSPTGTARRLALLAVQRPVSTQFKLWARNDATAPGGHGYPLLLVEQDKKMIVLSADPASRARVGFVAAALDEREKKARGGAEVSWYDGKDHGGTLAAAPREGTALSFDEVLQCLRAELRLHPIRQGKAGAKAAVVAGAAIALAAAAAFGIVALQKKNAPAPLAEAPRAAQAPERARPEAAPASEARPSGSKGDPLPIEEVVSLVERDDGPRSIEPYALIAGVCGYEGDHALHSPCRDARAMRDLLIKHYGYKRQNIVYLVDKPEPGDETDGAPTAERLKLAVEQFRQKFGDEDSSSFLFYYSGHGGYIKGARQDYGVLQPAEFFGKLAGMPSSHKGWDMTELIGDIRKGVPSRHVMLLLDCCYSGWAVGAKGEDELSTHLGSLWKERAEVVITAGSKGQRAWEDEIEQRAWVWGGHSALTAFVLEGLAVGAQGVATADANKDHVVTDEELARFVKERVPRSVEEQKHAKQTPTLFRFDESLPQSGQFLFVPGAKP